VKRWGLLISVLALLVAAGVTVRWWLAPLLKFVGANTDLIQGLADAIQIGLWLIAGVAGFIALVRRNKKPPAPPTKISMKKKAEAGGVLIEGDALNANIMTGQHNTLIQTETYIDKQIFSNPSTADPKVLRQAYLNRLFESCRALSLAGVDPKAASDPTHAGRLDLDAVYTALLTLTPETPERLARGDMLEKESRRVSALEQLNRHKHLVLLGDPGSGKSTFVNFVALCLAGEALGSPTANLKLLTAPLPKDQDEDKKEKETPQPWYHGSLLPVRIILRDFAARGLPPVGQKASTKHLCDFIAAELDPHALSAFAEPLHNELREKGGLLLLDGLDEVPESRKAGRTQIKQAVEDFAACFPRCRLLVTSRTYAYQQQDWRLPDFREAVLAPFSPGQIRRFVEHWYAHIGALRGLHPDDAQGRAELLKRAIFNSDRLQGLAERPLLLTLMASLHAWRGGSLPEKREELYADTVDLLLDWWERPKIVRDATGQLQVAQPSLAEWLKIDRKKVLDLLSALAYEAHGEQPELAGTADVPETKLVAGLMHLSQNPAVNPALLVKYLSERAGLLLPRGVGVYTFPHRTFQEYLAACYLTDQDYPDKLAELARADPNRWREAALLAAAKASRGSDFAVWALVDSLCHREPVESGQNLNALWGAHLAGQALVESAKLAKVSESNRKKVALVQNWLAHILQHADFPAVERALAGNTLALLGETRREVTTINEMQFCLVPKGPFWMGDEKELHRNDCLNYDYWISRHPVTNAQFNEFVQAGGYKIERYWPEAKAAKVWKDGQVKAWNDDKPRLQPHDFGSPFNLPNHPVVGITWYEMLAFTRWLTEMGREKKWLGEKMQIDLPSEAEWEKAARGGEEILPSRRIISLDKIRAEHYTIEPRMKNEKPQRRYPWSDDADSNRANYDETKIGATSVVGCFPQGASPYGCEDLSGNVWEWTRSLWGKSYSTPDFKYPYDPNDNRENLEASRDILRVLRGGSFGWDASGVRCAYRGGFSPNSRSRLGGFRLSARPLSPLSAPIKPIKFLKTAMK